MNPMEKGLCDWVELYALNGLEEEASALFELHLRDCAACRMELRELREVTELLPLAPEPVPVPVGMKRRVLERVLASDTPQLPLMGASAGVPVLEPDKDKTNSVERFGFSGTHEGISRRQEQPYSRVEESQTAVKEARGDHEFGATGDAADDLERQSTAATVPSRRQRRTRSVWARRGMAAAVLALVVAVGLLTRQNEQLGRQLAATQDRLDQLLASAGGVGQPMRDAHPEEAVALSPAAANIVSRGLATIVVDNKGTHLIVQAEKLPELKGTQAFQVWLLKDGKPSNAGTFTTTNGSGAVSFTLADNRAYDTLAITLEPDAYGDKPRGEMILKASLTGKS